MKNPIVFGFVFSMITAIAGCSGSDAQPSGLNESPTSAATTLDQESVATSNGDDTTGTVTPNAAEPCGHGYTACPSSEYCHYAGTGNACGRSEAGTCETRPAYCPPDPGKAVCGCDDRTYTSGCEAHAWGVSIAYDGECKPRN